MEGISKEELHIQYQNFENKPSMGFATLMSNVQYLQNRGSSSHSFVLRCSQDSPNGIVVLTIKCIMVNNYASLSNAVELYEQQCDIRGISEYIQCYESFYYNREDEVMNFARKGFYRYTIESIYKINSSRYGQGVLSRFDVVRQWIIQILELVSLLHERGLHHGGIKASNLFIDESSNQIRLADIGFSSKVALINYMQSQKYVYVSSNEKMKTKCQKFNDLYALVILIYQMTFGFDCTYHQIKQLQDGVPFDETEQDENPYDYDENDFKYRVIRLANQIICRAGNGNEETIRKVNIFYISDVLQMSRNIKSFTSSPKNIADILHTGFVDPVLANTQVPVTNQQQQQRVLSQEELLAQEMLYQQQKHEQEDNQKVQKQIYSNDNLTLQQKVDVYKKLDYEKYQKHSQQNSSHQSSPQKQIDTDDMKQQQQTQLEPNEVFVSQQFMNWRQEEKQIDSSQNCIDQKYEQEKQQYMQQQSQSVNINLNQLIIF